MKARSTGSDDTVEPNQPLDSQSKNVSASNVHSQTGNAGDQTEEVEKYEELATTNSSIHDDHGPNDVSRSVSVQSRPISLRKIPTAQRSGLFARLSLLYEAEDPKGYPRKIKWFITFNIALAAVAAPMGSSIILPALSDITEDFETTPTIANLSIALYMLSMSIFPLWWSSFSETSGRRAVYITSFALFIVWNVLAAVSTSIGMFIVMRVLSGGSSAAVQAVGAGTIADVWEVKERGKAMGIFYIGPLCGPLFAPIIGGGLAQGLGWRSTQWFQVIYGGVMLLLIVLAFPETHATGGMTTSAPAPSTSTAEKGQQRPPMTRTASHLSVATQKSRDYAVLARRILIDPLRITKYLRHPPVALTVYYASIAFGSLYVLNISIERTFSRPPYSFSTIIIGCLYISNSTGYLLASVLGGRWVDHIMHRRARHRDAHDPVTGKLLLRPEDRMGENVWTGGLLMPAALLWYGWTAQHGVYWLAPMVATFLFGAGSMLLFASATTMLTEFMPRRASNGVALNNFVRNIFSFVGTFVAEPLLRVGGNGWVFTGLAVVALGSCGVIVAMRRYGERWRVEMDRRMREEEEAETETEEGR